MKRKVSIHKDGNDSFDKMQYNPFSLSEGEMMWEKYPFFKRRAIYHSPQSIQTSEDIQFGLSLEQWNDIIRFIVLFVDNQSPFAPEREFDIRKDLCIEELDITDIEILNYIDDSNPFYSKALFEYFKSINNYEYSTWFSKLTSYYKNARFLMLESNSETDTEKRVKAEIDVNKYLSVLKDELMALEDKLFKDERIKANIKEKATEEELSGYPERFAKNIEY